MRMPLVLSGGSIKGAFQAGAIEEVLARGVVPSSIHGISVGSLNGGFLADRAGKAVLAGQQPDWPAYGKELGEFWRSQVTSFDVVATKRNIFSLAWSILRGRFNGLVNTDRLRRLINEALSEDALAACPIHFTAGAVDIYSGEIVEASASTHSGRMRDYIMASTAIPVMMPFRKVDGRIFVDGGLRDVAPTRAAMRTNTPAICAIVCQERSLIGCQFAHGNLLKLANRLMEIIVNETVNNDLDRLRQINIIVGQVGRGTLRSARTGREYRYVLPIVIRPHRALEIEFEHFRPQDITRIYELGKETARKVLEEPGIERYLQEGNGEEKSVLQ